MVSEQPARKVVKALKAAGWRLIRTEGSHSLYKCPCGQHTFMLPDGHRVISPGVVRKVGKALAECERWGDEDL
ncbi:type II toxin-antitoxin system HicA family toxin [Kribbella sp. NPDC026611]|uniref:type II toxin-antitoxin system HicA family toxin n=1 Tax=Kribbella sp. NPDC026611 TaxID=3154911 RepID=UPI0033D218F0